MNTTNERWTFGITSLYIHVENENISKENELLLKVIESIKKLNIPESSYEILIIGNNNLKSDINISNNIKLFFFDESIKKGWITKKKNILVEKSNFENVILIHDYISFNSDWYEGFQKFETDWDVCMVKILDQNKIRWRDWILWPGYPSYDQGYVIHHNNVKLAPNRLLYTDTRYTKTDMYINGTVIIGKRNFLIQNKFDENLCWGEWEDCEWSKKCRPSWKYKMNINSTLNLLKPHTHPSQF